MDDYTFTDEATVAKIADLSPRALSTYFLCLHNCDADGVCHFTRDQIINDHIRSWTKFKNDVRALAFLYVLNFVDDVDQIHLQMIFEDSREDWE